MLPGAFLAAADESGLAGRLAQWVLTRGGATARRMREAGFDVTVFDIRAATMQAVVAEHGGKAARSLAEVARGADAVITSECKNSVFKSDLKINLFKQLTDAFVFKHREFFHDIRL